MSIYWVKFEGVRLGIMPRPRGNDWLPIDLRILRQEGVDGLVSALTTPEAEELGLIAEAEECRKNGLHFLSHPIEDRSVPSLNTTFEGLVHQLVTRAKNGECIVIHCRAGIGRSSIIAACVLVRMGLSPDAAFRLLEQSRGCPVPDTIEQRQWVELYAASRASEQ